MFKANDYIKNQRNELMKQLFNSKASEDDSSRVLDKGLTIRFIENESKIESIRGWLKKKSPYWVQGWQVIFN